MRGWWLWQTNEQKKFAAEDRLKFCNVTRYSLHLSHLLGGAVAPFVAPSEAAPATTATTAAAGKPAGGKAPAKAVRALRWGGDAL